MPIPQSVIDRTKSADFENNISWMYLDTTGNVTVGAGHLIASANAATALAFIRNGSAASTQMKQQAWNTVHAMEPGRPANFYMNATTIRLPQESIDDILRHDMESAEGYLVNTFPGYNSFPSTAQEGLLDMMFNMGPNRFTRAHWPNFFARVDERDWNGAADNCHRAGIREARNQAVAALFRAVARFAEQECPSTWKE